MASAGIRKLPSGRYNVWWRLNDGSQGCRTFDTRALAREFRNELLAQAAVDAWTDPRRGRIPFDDWADHWWQLWSSKPPPAAVLRPPAAPPDLAISGAALAERA
jgi:hypothetical protein